MRIIAVTIMMWLKSIYLDPLARVLVGGGDGEGVYDRGCVGFDEFCCGGGLFFDLPFLGDCLAGICLTSAGGSCSLGCGLFVAYWDILPTYNL